MVILVTTPAVVAAVVILVTTPAVVAAVATLVATLVVVAAIQETATAVADATVTIRV